MSKYEPLARYLKSLEDDTWNATFSEIEAKLGTELPRSAREHRAWWANQSGGNHSQTAGWQGAGWETRDVDLRRGIVRFERRSREPVHDGDLSTDHDDRIGKLIERASNLSGIGDRTSVLEAALHLFIRREGAKRMEQLGGTMPDFSVPPRERPVL